MKLNVEVDCTPEEMRRLMGLPDLTPLHEKYIAMVSETMEGRVQPEMIETMIKNWGPMGEASLGFWQRMIEAGTKAD